MGWFSTHSGRWSPPIQLEESIPLAALGFCDTEKQSMVSFWPPKSDIRAYVKKPKLLSAGVGLFDSRKCWESIGRVIKEQDIKNIHKWQSGNQPYPSGEFESMRDCSSRSSVPVMTWWGEQSEQERLPKVSTPALSIANTKGDLRVAPAPTYLQDDWMPDEPPPLMLMSGISASWPCCCLKGPAKMRMPRLYSTVGTHLFPKLQPFWIIPHGPTIFKV